jgi:4-hydroxyphenylpyruvate dioxygenase
MEIDHVHFYVENARQTRDWFVNTLGFSNRGNLKNSHTWTEIVQSGSIYFAFSAALGQNSPVTDFLGLQAPGVADLALRVTDLNLALEEAIAAGAKLLQPIQIYSDPQGELRIAKIQGWGRLHHSLIQRQGTSPLLPVSAQNPWIKVADISPEGTLLQHIDHVVLNVAEPDLSVAIAWYEKVLGFRSDRSFAIQTQRSGLRSQVLLHPQGSARFPINEPASADSQIQEFLDINGGPGIQHIALGTPNILAAIPQLRQRGVRFLEIPAAYYQNLSQRLPNLPVLLDLVSLATQQILVDWQPESPEAVLLQIFTQPIFEQPTFFLEVIERRLQAQGFGEGNFLALFEAMEREQIKRSGLI